MDKYGYCAYKLDNFRKQRMFGIQIAKSYGKPRENTLRRSTSQNIFWQVAGTVNIGTPHNLGVILSQTGVTLATGT
jgi:hypothetical protein